MISDSSCRKVGGRYCLLRKKSMAVDHRAQMTDRILLKHGTLGVQWDPMLMSCRASNLCAWRLSVLLYIRGFKRYAVK